MNVSFQLYSARETASWSDTFQELAALGYTQVEGYGANYADPAATRAMLDQAGLTMPSGHFSPIDQFEDDFVGTIGAARALGMKRLFCPAPEEALRNSTDPADWIAFGKTLATVGERVRDAGLSFGWHNHHWEFMPLPDGQIPMQLILDNAPAIDWEMDVAWVVRGGADPLDWIARNADRITTAHVKDIAPEGEAADEDGWADVGHGTMDWATLYGALRDAGVDLFVMEHDKPSDISRFASRSIAAFKSIAGA